MSTLKIEHISHLDNGTPDLSIDSSGHLNIVNGNLQMGGVTMLNTSTGAPLPLSGGAMTGVISNFESTGIDDQATSNVLTILSNGSVGIGATGSARFTLSGTASANDLSSAMVFALGASTKLYLGASNATDNVITGSSLGDTVLRSNGNNILFSVDSGASSAVYIKSDGNVGIGTDDPGCALDITRTSGWAEMHLDGAAGGDLILKDDGVNYGEIYAGSGHGMVLKSYASQHMSFLTNADATAKMTIQSGGNVGIGTDSPSYKLDVASTIQIRAGESLRLQNVAGSSAATIQCAGAGTNSDLGFSTAGAERMRITSTGVLQGSSDAEISTSPIRTHSNTISTSTTIDANDNAVASGPLAIADGVTLTINGNMTVV